MKLRTRLAALAIGAAAAVAPLTTTGTANAVPASTETVSTTADSGGEENWYYWDYYWGLTNCEAAFLDGWSRGWWSLIFRCTRLGTSNWYELYVDPYFA